MFANALEFIISQNGVTDVVHYLDDYLTGGPAQIDVCKANLDTMLLEHVKRLVFLFSLKKLRVQQRLYNIWVL